MKNSLNYIEYQAILPKVESVIWGDIDLSEIDSAGSSVTMTAERYGGMGTGLHGGGARAANLSSYQLKGVGLTPVAGDMDNVNYMHGTLHLTEAVLELIFSKILSGILPVGVVDCIGLLETGKYASYRWCDDAQGELESARGALLARDICLRPGHFFRSPKYKVPERLKKQIPDDLTRIRSAVGSLASDLVSPESFIQFIARFLSACAMQFSFSYVAGIAHGAISPSNLCVDGRWLDLATASFLPRGKNWQIAKGGIFFDDEKTGPISIAIEWVYTYSKFTGVDFDIAPLVGHYQSQYTQQQSYHSVYLLGIDRDIICELEHSESLETLKSDILESIKTTGRVIVGVPEEELSGARINQFLDDFYTSLASDFDNNNEPCANIILFRSILAFIDRDMSLVGCIKQSMIKAYKRNYVSPYFYRQRIISTIEGIYNTDETKDFTVLIQEHIDVAKWVLCDDFNETEIVYSSGDVVVEYKVNTNEYTLMIASRLVGVFNVFQELLDACQKLSVRFSIGDYRFNRYLQKLSEILGLFDRNKLDSEK